MSIPIVDLGPWFAADAAAAGRSASASALSRAFETTGFLDRLVNPVAQIGRTCWEKARDFHRVRTAGR